MKKSCSTPNYHYIMAIAQGSSRQMSQQGLIAQIECFLLAALYCTRTYVHKFGWTTTASFHVIPTIACRGQGPCRVRCTTIHICISNRSGVGAGVGETSPNPTHHAHACWCSARSRGARATLVLGGIGQEADLLDDKKRLAPDLHFLGSKTERGS